MTEGFIQLVLFQLFVIILLAKVVGGLFERFKIPSVLGEIGVGIVIGNTFLFEALQLGGDVDVFEVLRELGIIFLLFSIGLETPFSELRRTGSTAFLTAILGVAFPLAFGFLFVFELTDSTIESLFLAASMVATSVGITARVIRDLGRTEAIESRVILGAAIIDDILGMMVLAFVVETTNQSAGPFDALVAVIEAVIFVIAIVVFGLILAPKIRRKSLWNIGRSPERQRSRYNVLSLPLIVCFGLSFLAAYLNLAAIIGAFLAGMIFADYRDRWPCKNGFRFINEFLVPFFFVFIGVSVDLSTLGSVIWLALAITILAIATKFVGCSIGSNKLGFRSAAIIGVGMTPRGEVGLIVASVGLSAAAISSSNFDVIVLMSIATTLAMPPLLSWGFKIIYEGNQPAASQPAERKEES